MYGCPLLFILRGIFRTPDPSWLQIDEMFQIKVFLFPISLFCRRPQTYCIYHVMLCITGHAVHSDPSLAHLVTTPTLTQHYPLHFRDISFDIDRKEGEVGQWPLFFFFLAKIWSCRKMPCHQCSASSWAAWFLSPVNKLFCVSSLAAAELMRRIFSIELCHRTCWTSCYFHKSLIKKKTYLQWCFFL